MEGEDTTPATLLQSPYEVNLRGKSEDVLSGDSDGETSRKRGLRSYGDDGGGGDGDLLLGLLVSGDSSSFLAPSLNTSNVIKVLVALANSVHNLSLTVAKREEALVSLASRFDIVSTRATVMEAKVADVEKKLASFDQSLAILKSLVPSSGLSGSGGGGGGTTGGLAGSILSPQFQSLVDELTQTKEKLNEVVLREESLEQSMSAAASHRLDWETGLDRRLGMLTESMAAGTSALAAVSDLDARYKSAVVFSHSLSRRMDEEAAHMAVKVGDLGALLKKEVARVEEASAAETQALSMQVRAIERVLSGHKVFNEGTERRVTSLAGRLEEMAIAVGLGGERSASGDHYTSSQRSQRKRERDGQSRGGPGGTALSDHERGHDSASDDLSDAEEIDNQGEAPVLVVLSGAVSPPRTQDGGRHTSDSSGVSRESRGGDRNEAGSLAAEEGKRQGVHSREGGKDGHSLSSVQRILEGTSSPLASSPSAASSVPASASPSSLARAPSGNDSSSSRHEAESMTPGGERGDRSGGGKGDHGELESLVSSSSSLFSRGRHAHIASDVHPDSLGPVYGGGLGALASVSAPDLHSGLPSPSPPPPQSHGYPHRLAPVPPSEVASESVGSTQSMRRRPSLGGRGPTYSLPELADMIVTTRADVAAVLKALAALQADFKSMESTTSDTQVTLSGIASGFRQLAEVTERNIVILADMCESKVTRSDLAILTRQLVRLRSERDTDHISLGKAPVRCLSCNRPQSSHKRASVKEGDDEFLLGDAVRSILETEVSRPLSTELTLMGSSGNSENVSDGRLLIIGVNDSLTRNTNNTPAQSPWNGRRPPSSRPATAPVSDVSLTPSSSYQKSPSVLPLDRAFPELLIGPPKSGGHPPPRPPVHGVPRSLPKALPPVILPLEPSLW